MEIVKTGVAIHTCASCNGIWLDKGKLSALMNQMKQAEAALDQELGVRRDVNVRPDPRYLERDRDHHKDSHDDHHYDDHHDKYKYKKKSIFDFFD